MVLKLLTSVLFGFLLFSSPGIKAQDPVDCVSAVIVCDNQQLNYNSNGPGINDFGPGPNDFANGCLLNDEHQSAWFEIYISPNSPPNATLAFTLTPTGGWGQDYDFALYGPNTGCSNLGNPIRCSFADNNCFFCPETGLGMGTTDYTEDYNGDGFVAEVITQPGQSYILLIDNWSSSNIGFFLDWTGTALLSCSCTTVPVITGNDEICTGETAVLTATGTNLATYSWSASSGGSIVGPTNGSSINANSTGVYTVTVTDDEGCTGSASIEVTQSAGPQIDFSVEPSTCGLSNGAIELTITGSNPFSFAWSNNATTEDLANIPAGSYTVTVTDANGCTATSAIEVEDENQALSITGDVTHNTSCIGGNGSISVFVSPPGTYTYVWSNGESNSSLFDLTPGTYNLTVTSTGSCTGTATFTVQNQPEEPVISTDITSAVCDLANGAIDISVTGGVAPYSFDWSGGQTTEDLTNVPSGTYSLTVTGDNGCTDVMNITLPNNNPPVSITATVLPNTSCNASNGSISTTINPAVSPSGQPYTYIWSNGSTDQNLTGLGSGTYTITVSGGGSCTSEASFTIIDEPDVHTINANIIAAQCGDDNGAIQLNVSGGIPPFTYLWNNGSTDPDQSGLMAGNYSVTVTGTNGCTAEATFTVPDEQINFNVNSTIEPNTSCTDDYNGSISVTVFPAGTYTYSWNNGESSTTLLDLAPGNYTLTVSAGGICEQEVFFVVPDQPLLPEFSISTTSALCDQANGSATITITGGESPFTFQWSNGESTQNIQNVSGGNYSVTVTGANECEAVATVTVPNEQINIQMTNVITPNTSCISGNGAIDVTVTPTSGLTFEWSTGATTQNINNLSSGNYSLTVSAGGSCESIYNFTVPDATIIPVINLTAVSASCGQANGSINLTMNAGTAPFEYSWSSGEAYEDLTNVEPGNYSVTVTDALGCSSSSSITVNNNIIPITITGETTPNSSCEFPNGSIDISVSPFGSYSYAWSNGEDTEDLSSLDPGTYTVTVTLGDLCTSSASFVVGNNISEPILETSVTPAVCGEANGAINLTISGSVPPYTIDWSTGENSEDITDLLPGNYTVTVTGANDCSVNLSVNVPNNSSSFSITGDVSPLTSCAVNNGMIDLSIDPPGTYEFLWSTGEITEDISGLGEGEYSVTVTLAGSCSGFAVFTIENATSLPTYTAQVGFDQCDLGTGSIELTNITGDGPFTFLWSGGQINASIDSLLAGSYSVTVTDINGCMSSSTHTVASNNLDISFTASSMPNTVCSSPNGSIELTVTPSEDYTFLWSNGATTEDLNGLASGNYTVTISHGSCSTTGTVFVGADASAISLNTEAKDVSCFGENDGFIHLEAGGGSPPFTYNWSPSVPGSPADLTDLTAGTYSVTVTDQAGCSITSSFIIGEPEQIVMTCYQSQSVSAPGLSDGAAGLQLAGGTPPYSVTWSPGSSQTGIMPGLFNINNLAEGNYNVEVVDDNGCMSICDFTITAEDCMTATGTMGQQAIGICGEGCATAMYDDAGEVLNTGDLIQFVLHRGSGGQIQNEIARSNQPEFCFDPAIMQYNVQYFISAVAGPDDGAGNVMLSGPCAKVASGTPVMFREIPIASIDEPGVIDCDNPEIEIVGHSTIPASDFHWSSRPGNILSDPELSSIIVNQNGFYELVVTSFMCKDTAGVQVESSDDYPSLSTGPVGDLNCIDREVILTGSAQQTGVLLEWATISNGDTTIIGSGETLTVNAPGIYYLLGDGGNGCISSAALTVEELISSPFVDAGADIILNCDQAPVMVNAQGSADVSYLWTSLSGIPLPVNDQSSLLVDQPGIYTVLVTDTFTYCTAIDTLVVLTHQGAPESYVETKNISCYGVGDGSILVQPEQGDSPFTFFLNGVNNGQEGSFSSLNAGIYTIEVVDAGGCRWTTEVEITEPDLLTADLGADLSISPGEVITLEVITNIAPGQIESIIWDPEKLSVCLDDPCTRIRYTLHESTEVGVMVIDTNGCVAEDVISITVVDDKKIYVPNIFSPNGDGKNDEFTVFAGAGVRMVRRLSIFNRWGDHLFMRENFVPNDPSLGWDGTYRGDYLNPGVFTWKAEIEFEDGKQVVLFGDVTLVR